MSKSLATPPDFRDRRGQHRPVGVAELTGGRRLIGRNQLVTCDENGNARPRDHPDSRAAEFAQDGDFDRPDRRARRDHDITARERHAAAHDVLSRRRRTVGQFDAVRLRLPWARSIITTASAPGGIGAPVMIRVACPDEIARVGTAPAMTSSITAKSALPVARSADRIA